MTHRINATKLLVKELPKEEKTTKAGIIIPGSVMKEPSAIGRVVLKGVGTPSLPTTDINIGDMVLYSPHALVRLVIPEREETKDLPLSGEYGLLDLKDCLLVF